MRGKLETLHRCFCTHDRTEVFAGKVHMLFNRKHKRHFRSRERCRTRSWRPLKRWERTQHGQSRGRGLSMGRLLVLTRQEEKVCINDTCRRATWLSRTKHQTHILRPAGCAAPLRNRGIKPLRCRRTLPLRLSWRSLACAVTQALKLACLPCAECAYVRMLQAHVAFLTLQRSGCPTHYVGNRIGSPYTKRRTR